MTSLIAQELGRLGGEKTYKKYGKAHYIRMSKLAAKARKLSTAKQKQDLLGLAVGGSIK